MKTLLILTRQPSMSSAIQSVLDLQRYQIVTKQDARDADSLLLRGVIDATILDADLTDVKAVRSIEEIRKSAPDCPILIYAGAKQWEWEENAYLLGVEHVLMKPVRAKMLNMLLDRVFKEPEHKPLPLERRQPAASPSTLHGFGDQVQALEALHRFSGVLTHSLDSDALLREVLLLIREIVNVNRAVIFLRNPASLFGEGMPGSDDYCLRSACAIGLEPALLKHFALSLGEGIGAHLRMQGRILKASSPEAHSSRDITKEFQILGARVAIPILDRETLIGVAVFDERLTGEPYENEELTLIFHILEQVGMAIRNSWLHDQLVGNHSMIADILGTMASGCVVISGSLSVLHANAAAKKCLLAGGNKKPQLEFADLPQDIGSKVFTVIKSCEGIPPFLHQFAGSPGAFHQISIAPFSMQTASGANAVLLLIEDITERVRAQRTELEASNLRLAASMGERLAHEIGNSIVPISTHQQLFGEKIDDPEFRRSLSTTMADGVARISRLARQMVFLAGERPVLDAEVRLTDLIAEAWQEAFAQTGAGSMEPLSRGDWIIPCDRKALRHALFEILLNAIQAGTPNSRVSVQIAEVRKMNGLPELKIDIRDTGPGFSAEVAQRATEPFFTTRQVGLGIGLTLARNIIENHNGRIEIVACSNNTGYGNVHVIFPIPAVESTVPVT